MRVSYRLAILLVVVCALVAHAGTLFNGFVGDDNMLIVNNTAYRSWDNFGRLLFDDYIIDINKIFNGSTKFLGSSDVSYRPVKSATHFVDYAIWKLNPFGYHLNNLVLHTLNSVLVFILLNIILRNPNIALFTAALFATHPIQSEAVSGINYRHNLLIVFFLLLAMLSYIRSCRSHKFFFLFLSYICFFLGLFSKEAALIFPLIIIAYDMLIQMKRPRQVFEKCITDYVGYWMIILFFGYVYLYVFPNVVSSNNKIFGGDWITHGVHLVRILFYYLKSFVMPWSVKSLPPFFNVHVEHLWSVKTCIGVSAICGITGLYLHLLQTNRKVCFMLFWFIVSYAIVSNIVPFANPVSFRFMYFPSIGLFAVFAFYFYKALVKSLVKIKSEKIVGLVMVSVIIMCISWTWPLDASWRNDRTMTIKMYRDFPNNARANMFAGMTMYRMQNIKEAERLLRKAYALQLEDPRVYHYLGLIYLNDRTRSEPLFEQCINGFPHFAACYAGLGRIKFLTGRHQEALSDLQMNREAVASYSTYGYLIQIHLMNGEKQSAQIVYLEAIDRISNKEQKASLARLIKEDVANFPIDLGF